MCVCICVLHSLYNFTLYDLNIINLLLYEYGYILLYFI